MSIYHIRRQMFSPRNILSPATSYLTMSSPFGAVNYLPDPEDASMFSKGGAIAQLDAVIAYARRRGAANIQRPLYDLAIYQHRGIIYCLQIEPIGTAGTTRRRMHGVILNRYFTDICPCCGVRLHDRNTAEIVIGDRNICINCEEDVGQCEICGEHRHIENITTIDDVSYCASCFNERFTTCNNCGARVTIADSFRFGCYDYCDECYLDLFESCQTCGEVIRREDIIYDERRDIFVCEDCHQPSHHAINSYGHSRSPEFLQSQTDPSNARFYLGIEIEVDTDDGSIVADEVAQEIRDTDYPWLNDIKEDGSLSDAGFEIVTHALTPSYIKEHSREIKDLLTTLDRGGYKGHGRGGIHIHMSRNAFTGLEIVKLCHLMRSSQSLMEQIAQRNGNGYCKFSSSPSAWRDIAEGAVLRRSNIKNVISSDRYSAINLTKETIEIRIYNSTTRHDRLMHRIEHAISLKDFVKSHGLREMHETAYRTWLTNNALRYPHLVTFLSLDLVPKTAERVARKVAAA